MFKFEHIYALGFLVVTIATYIIIFGSAGLIIQEKLSDNLLELQDDVSSLEKENNILNERYIQLLESSTPKFKIPEKEETVIILKFQNLKKETQINNNKKNTGSLNLLEARILYLSSMFFMGLLGYVALNKWRKSKQK